MVTPKPREWTEKPAWPATWWLHWPLGFQILKNLHPKCHRVNLMKRNKRPHKQHLWCRVKPGLWLDWRYPALFAKKWFVCMLVWYVLSCWLRKKRFVARELPSQRNAGLYLELLWTPIMSSKTPVALMLNSQNVLVLAAPCWSNMWCLMKAGLPCVACVVFGWIIMVFNP